MNKYFQIIIDEENIFNRLDLSFMKLKRMIWQMNDSDQQIEKQVTFIL